jgi:aminoglycoside phosphotransferase family enzyme/predicted kinase
MAESIVMARRGFGLWAPHVEKWHVWGVPGSEPNLISRGEWPGPRPEDTDARVVETHVSTLFFVGERVYKLKKPVRTAFLDWSTPERRHQACLLEVALNARLAPDVYLGVAGVVGPEGAPCDSLVVMRRLPASRSLAHLVGAGIDVTATLRLVAHRLAAFHSRCQSGPEVAPAGSPEAVLANWRDNCAQMYPYGVEGVLAPDVLDAVAGLSESYVCGRRRLFEHRMAAGRVRDGHGDLLSEDIYVLDDGVRILDCLEFDARFRYADVLADVAFLAMDLERLGAPDQAASFLSWYREFSGDTWPGSLAHHWIAYRAQVRAKVACLAHDQGDRAAAAQAASLLAMCNRHLRLGAVRLVLIGGLPGTGKTTIANAMADRLSWTLLSSDELRHQLVPAPTGPADYRQGRYQPDVTSAVYRELLDQASRCLAFGQSVIIDASWIDERWRREAAAIANRGEADLVELVCDAPSALAEQRIEARARIGLDFSDATPGIALRMAADADPWPAARRLDTSIGSDSVLRSALDQVCPDWEEDAFAGAA